MQIMQFASPAAFGPKRKMWEGPLYGHAGAVAQRFPYRFQEVFEDHFSTPGRETWSASADLQSRGLTSAA